MTKEHGVGYQNSKPASSFFSRSCNVLVEQIAQSEVDNLSADGKELWSALKDFLDIRDRSIADALSVTTNEIVNLVAAKREFVLRFDDDEKKALRAISPLDKRGRLFRGKLHSFME